MHPSQETPIETCERVETMLREVQQLAGGSGADVIAVCETQLGRAVALLEGLQAAPAPTDLQHRQLLLEIRRLSATLKLQFEHGSNYCMGLLQMRLGTGYSDQGLPVLFSHEARTLFQG
jgi:hypothetical protein